MWGSIISAGAGLLGSALQSSAVNRAARQSAAASREAQAGWNTATDTALGYYQPYADAGTSALSQYQAGIDTPTTAADVMQDPGYQFGLTQGQQAIDRRTAAAGGRVSGAAIKAANQYATNYATTGYQQAYQRGQNRLAQLANLAGMGQSTAGSMAGLQTQRANAIGNLLTGAGDTQAAATLARGNIWGNLLSSTGAGLARQYGNTGTTGTSSIYGDMSRQQLGLG